MSVARRKRRAHLAAEHAERERRARQPPVEMMLMDIDTGEIVAGPVGSVDELRREHEALDAGRPGGAS